MWGILDYSRDTCSPSMMPQLPPQTLKVQDETFKHVQNISEFLISLSCHVSIYLIKDNFKVTNKPAFFFLMCTVSVTF